VAFRVPASRVDSRVAGMPGTRLSTRIPGIPGPGAPRSRAHPGISAPKTDISARSQRFLFLAGLGPLLGRCWAGLGWFWPGLEDLRPEGRIYTRDPGPTPDLPVFDQIWGLRGLHPWPPTNVHVRDEGTGPGSARVERTQENPGYRDAGDSGRPRAQYTSPLEDFERYGDL
jgi:hypothetical protein